MKLLYPLTKCKTCQRSDGKQCYGDNCDYIQGCSTCKHKTNKVYCETIQLVNEKQCIGFEEKIN